MEPAGLSKHTVSFGLALAIASVVNGVLVIAKEKSPAVQAAMQKLTGSHWVTHVVIGPRRLWLVRLAVRTGQRRRWHPAGR